MERVVLLNPGPVTLSPRVRQALHQRPDYCHREQDFADLMLRVRGQIEGLYASASGFESVVVTGSGTCAVEAMISSFAPRERKTLVVANGVYGARMFSMLERHGRSSELLEGPWTAGPDLGALAAALDADQAVSHVAVVHHETTTGRLTDLAGVGEVCKGRGRKILLDGVSSFGAESIDFETWGIQAMAATANKCLHGIPGLAFVMADREALTEGTSQADSLYLDLFAYYNAQQTGFSPFTPATHSAVALEEALLELSEAGGVMARRSRYAQLTADILGHLVGLGVEPLLRADESSSMLTAYHLPTGWSYDRLHDFLRSRGFVIYGGQGDLAGSIFRISTMGDITDDDLARLESAFSEALSTDNSEARA